MGSIPSDGASESLSDLDFGDVKGQEGIKRALEIAAAGGHNAILIGPPGAGKTMLAKRLPTILPPLSLPEALETTKIHSVADRLAEDTALLSSRPFRSPHHTISAMALIGEAAFPNRERSRWRITGSYSWMNYRSSAGMYWKCCGNRWKTGR